MGRQTHPLDVRSSPSRPTVRSGSMRKLAKDGTSWTPSEKLKRDRLMKQFAKKGRKGYELSGNSPEYASWYDQVDWGRCKCFESTAPDGLCGHCRSHQ